MKKKVKIAIGSYNFSEYIAEAIESVLMQKTKFPFGIVIADDGSTDGSQEIIKKYANKYPNKIEALLSPKNLGARLNGLRMIRKFNSEYISFLDGDDFWIGEHKLQKQIDFLEKNKNYTMCGGQTALLYNDGKVAVTPPDQFKGKTYTFHDYFFTPILIHTSSVVYRNIMYRGTVPSYVYNEFVISDSSLIGEDERRVMHLEHGPLYMLPEIISCYRQTGTGQYTSSSNAKKQIWQLASSVSLRRYFHGRYDDIDGILQDRIKSDYQTMMRILINEKFLYPENRLSYEETRMLMNVVMDMKKEEDLCKIINS